MSVSESNKQMLVNLLTSFHSLNSFKKFFFPKTLKRALNAIKRNPEDGSYLISTQDASNIILAYKRATSFQKSSFSCLRKFRSSKLMQAYNFLKEELRAVNEAYQASKSHRFINALIRSEVPCKLALAIKYDVKYDEPHFLKDNALGRNYLKIMVKSEAPGSAAIAIRDSIKLGFLSDPYGDSPRHLLQNDPRLHLEPVIYNCILKYKFPEFIADFFQSLLLHGLLNVENIELIDQMGIYQFYSSMTWDGKELFKPLSKQSEVAEAIDYNQNIFDTLIRIPDKEILQLVAGIFTLLHRQNIFVKMRFNVQQLNQNYSLSALNDIFIRVGDLFAEIYKQRFRSRDENQSYIECLFQIFLKLSETEVGIDVNKVLRPWMTSLPDNAKLLRDALQNEHGFELLCGRTATFWKRNNLRALKYSLVEGGSVFTKICSIAKNVQTFEEGKSLLDDYLSEALSHRSQPLGDSRERPVFFTDQPPTDLTSDRIQLLQPSF